MTVSNLCIISNLEKLVKKLSDDNFKYLTQEFGSENLNLLKQKDAYPYEYTWTVLKGFLKKRITWQKTFL